MNLIKTEISKSKIKYYLLLYRLFISHKAFPFVIEYEHGLDEIKTMDLDLLEEIDKYYQAAEKKISFTYQEWLANLNDEERIYVERKFEEFIAYY
ncbi:hypothetical protein AXA84_0474 [Candidatus Phytoplasma oryzae]|uniref:Uncharacterized protein n=1 Tax=Candidatus Phytoplasma oryzae TaxID=203274 RepID=A0A139JPV0_9MOLU|nr:hypothetical protein [Candidatus Phytoplasma oryzae]KXT29013.1 hypothetical protein AXA84_0474 [Candidatus Phytoplasma oryzae]